MENKTNKDKNKLLLSFRLVVVFLKFYLVYFLSSAYFLCKIIFLKTKPIKRKYKQIAVLRTPASTGKIRNVINDDVGIFFDFIGRENSLYSVQPMYERLILIFVSFFDGFREVKKITRNLALVGHENLISGLSYYSKRLFHTILYKSFLKKLISDLLPEELYSGNNLDRFAIIEEETCLQFGIKLVCIPHGLEYGFMLPHEFTGDVFYCTSKYSYDFLSDLYNSTKYVYKIKIAKKMFSRERNSVVLNKRIVFFTEPREVHINVEIIEKLVNKLKFLNMKLWLKLHPKDSISNYQKFNEVHFINDFDEAISNNVCIARKSTILLEAVYNSSIAIAILLNKKDINEYNLFPSLKDDRITRTYNYNELLFEIQKYV